MKNRKAAFFTVCLFVTAGSPAFAKDWTVDYAGSHLGFTGTQGSTNFSGEFKKFQITLDFDPAKPEAGKITTSIDMASADAGSDERNGALPQSEWFDTSKFPQAQFTSSSVATDACNVITPASTKLIGCFKAAGALSIKGVSKPVTLGFYLVQDGDHVRARGIAHLIRTDFGVGQGQWSDEAFVKHAVDVTIDIAAKPAP